MSQWISLADTSTPDALQPETNGSITLIVLYDNYAYDDGLKKGWGFACLVKGLGKTLLFDTGGDGAILLSNMNTLGVNPTDVDVVVLSHYHRDHTGGLGAFLAENHNVTVFVPISFPERFKRRVRAQGGKVVSVDKPCGICIGAQTTGQLGTRIREQALCISTSDGLFVLTGCAHPGVVRVFESARELCASGVCGIMGGFHMKGFSEKKVREIVEKLKAMGVAVAAPCHCSGDHARRMMRQSFRSEYANVGVGATVQLVVGTRNEMGGCN
jgi:7,8-dihydropterin-6-yl-methyl-4-(beta-D-ribofuranosyl)aminobenzene 5'-phosphate synthase